MARVAAVEAYVLRAPLRGVFRIAYSESWAAETVAVSVVLSDGTRGWGEAAPAPRVTFEDRGSVLGYVEAVGRRLLGLELPGGLGAAVERVHAGAPGFSSARAALEAAVVDAASKLLGAPAHLLLGGARAGRLETDYTVSIPDERVLREVAAGRGPGWEAFREAVEYLVGRRSTPPRGDPGFPVPPVSGFRVLKVKLGTGSPELDVALALRVAEAAGESVRVRVDANQAWSLKQALRVLSRLEERLGWRLELVEQPVPMDRLEWLAELRRRLETPVAADESARSRGEVFRVAAAGVADVVNIKVAKVGGPVEASRAAAVAEAAGLEVMWGCMVETGLGVLQALHPALSSAATRYVDLDSPLFLDRDPVKPGPRYQGGGGGVWVEPPETAGLGGEPLGEALEGPLVRVA